MGHAWFWSQYLESRLVSIEVWLLGLSWAHVRCRPVTGVGACSGCLSSSGDLGCHHTLVWLQGLAAGMCMALEACDGSWRQWPAGAGCQHVQLCRPVTRVRVLCGP